MGCELETLFCMRCRESVIAVNTLGRPGHDHGVALSSNSQCLLVKLVLLGLERERRDRRRRYSSQCL